MAFTIYPDGKTYPARETIAAIRTGRNLIGYEMNTEFYNRALKRIDETMRTPTLF